MARVKYIPAEIDGVNQVDECERLLDANDVALIPDVDGFTDVDTWIRNFAGTGSGGDFCVGGAGATYVFLSGEEVGGCDASGN